MADKIESKDILSPDVIKKFQELNKELENTLSIMSTLSKEFIKSDTALKGAVKSTNDLQKAEEKSNKEKNKLTENEKELIRIEQQQQKILQSSAGSYNQLNAQLVKARLEYKRLSEEQRKGVGGKEMLKNIQSLDKKLKDFDKTMGQSQRNVGNYGQAFQNVKGTVVGFLGVFGGAAAIFSVFKKAINSTGITEDKWHKAMFQAQTATDAFFKSVALGDPTLKSFGERLKEIVEAAGEYFDNLDKLEDQNRSLRVQESERNIEIQRLITIQRDATKSDEERLAAGKEAERMQIELINERVKLTGTAAAAEVEFKSKLTGLSEAQLLQYVKEFDSLEELLKVGNKYNDLVKERDKIIARGSRGMIRGKDREAAQALNKEIEAMGPFAKASGAMVIKYGNQTKAEYDKIADAIVKFYDSISAKDEELRRIKARNSALQKEVDDKNFERLIKEQQIQQDINNTILNKKLDLETVSETQQNILDADIAKFREYYEAAIEADEEIVKADEAAFEKQVKNAEELAKIREEKVQLQRENILGLAELNNTLLDGQIEKNEYAKQKELEAAGDNERRKEQIEKKYAAKNADLRRKQAMIDKAAALFDIAINTAVQVTKAAIPLKPWIIAQGLIQAGIVAAKPIPKFAKGVRNFEGGYAEVGELGTELIKTPAGDIFLTPNEATKMILPKGSDVFTHTETKEILGNGVSIGKWDEMIKEQKETRKALSKQTKNNLSITPEGWKYTQEKNNQRIKYIDKYFRI